jgi:hypothetical protein
MASLALFGRTHDPEPGLGREMGDNAAGHSKLPRHRSLPDPLVMWAQRLSDNIGNEPQSVGQLISLTGPV